MPAIRDENGLFAGTMIGKYKIERALGAGGFGITYRAEDPLTGKLWAIKEFYPRQFHTAEGLKLPTAGTEEATDFEFARDKFLEEAKHLLAFNHPNIVGVHQPPVEANGTFYITMDFVEGKSLEQRLQAMGRPMSETELRPIFEKVLDAVAYLHDHDYMHRDLSPDNIMLRPDDTPVLIDFGTLGVGLDRRGTTFQFRRDEYSPPEQGLVGIEQGAYSDIFALGGVLYRALTGRPPVSANVRANTLARKKPDPYVSLVSHFDDDTAVSKALLNAVDQALDLDENDRPQSIHQWKRLLSWDGAPESIGSLPAGERPTHIVNQTPSIPLESLNPSDDQSNYSKSRSSNATISASGGFNAARPQNDAAKIGNRKSGRQVSDEHINESSAESDSIAPRGNPPDGGAHRATPSPQINYQIGQDNITPFGLDIHNPVFLISGISIVAFVIVTLVFQAGATIFFGWLRPFLTSTFDWFFLSAANIFVLFCIVLLVTPLGSVRLGGKAAKPDYSYLGWFAMLFAAGMGIGLMFFGVSEPMSHFGSSLAGTTAEGGVRTDWAPLGAAKDNVEAARNLGMAATIFHWALHPWAIYAVVALSLAFFTYNRGLPLTLRSAFYPILGERVWGWWGHIIDTLAVFATLFGLATSLGFGTEQALAGLNHLFGWGTGNFAKVLLIAGITAIALISVLRGLDGGVKVLSEVNIGMAALLLLFVIVVGPTATIFETIFAGGVAYVKELVPLSMPFGREDANFSQGWTAFYWAWWISWSPFVGMFIARVSRGRTVREFVFCVIVIPTLVCVAWMGAFGGTAISQVVADAAAPVKSAALELKLFEMLKPLPLAGVTSFIGIVLVLVFFITSSDSGSLVIDTITAGGKTDAPVSQRVFWCTFEGVVAATLLLVGGAGALTALQAMAVSTGFPFTIVLLAMCVSLFIGLQQARKSE